MIKISHVYDENKNEVVALPEGKIDSVNAGEAEIELMQLRERYPEAEILLDAEKLEYISSAGLRVLLKLRKTQQKLKVVNVNLALYEILEMTGFTEMLEVKKALREISVEGCEIIGEGGHGKVIRLNGDTIVKLFHPGTPIEDSEREREYAKKAFILGVPTAIPFDTVKCGDAIGLVFEMMDCDTLSQTILKNPDRFHEFAIKYAELLKTLHATEVEPGVLNSAKLLYRERIDRLAELGYFTEKEIADLHRINDAFEDKNVMIHGDFHPKNIMVRDDELIMIDMADISYGNPIYDLGSMALTHVITDDAHKEGTIGMPAKMVDELWNVFISAYLDTTDPEKIGLTTKKAAVFAMLKAATALAFVPQINTEFLINGIAAMVRENLLNDVESYLALIKLP